MPHTPPTPEQIRAVQKADAEREFGARRACRDRDGAGKDRAD